MISKEFRVPFAKLLREIDRSAEPPELLHTQFVNRLTRLHPDFADPSKIDDRTLNAAWNFCDYYFDAIGHRFTDCNGMPMDLARKKFEELIASLDQGNELTEIGRASCRERV